MTQKNDNEPVLPARHPRIPIRIAGNSTSIALSNIPCKLTTFQNRSTESDSGKPEASSFEGVASKPGQASDPMRHGIIAWIIIGLLAGARIGGFLFSLIGFGGVGRHGLNREHRDSHYRSGASHLGCAPRHRQTRSQPVAELNVTSGHPLWLQAVLTLLATLVPRTTTRIVWRLPSHDRPFPEQLRFATLLRS